MTAIDFDSDLGKRVLGQLESEGIVWLTTVSPSGQPQPSPVWFLWRDGKILVLSEPSSPKVRNIRQNPNVAVSFNTDPNGAEVSILQCTAALEADLKTAEDAETFADYEEKYREGIKQLNLTAESMLTQYSQLIVITPTRLRAW